MKNLEKIIINGKLLAIILRADFKKQGLEFFTPDEYPQQMAYMSRPKGHVITPHIHKQFLKRIKLTQEVLFIRSGKVKVDFYDEKRCYVKTKIVKRGDIVFLAFGGHGFKFLQDGEMVEIKQGPYNPDSREALNIKDE